MKGLQLHLEGAINIVDRFFGIDLEQFAKAYMRFDVDSHRVCESADCTLDYRATIQRLIPMLLSRSTQIEDSASVTSSTQIISRIYLLGGCQVDERASGWFCGGDRACGALARRPLISPAIGRTFI